MDNLLFSANATLPIFLLIVFGFALRRAGVVSEQLASGMNAFAFRVSIPVLLFADLAAVDVLQVWDTRFVGFCFAVTLACILAAGLLSLAVARPGERGEFIQASYRSSAALLGIAFIVNIYGSSGMASLMIIGSVPLYNVAAVVILEVFRPQEATDSGASSGGLRLGAGVKGLACRAAKGIVTNPILVSIAAGVVWSLLGLPMPEFAGRTLEMLGNTAAPMGLVAMGALVSPQGTRSTLMPAAVASACKLVGFAMLGLPLAVSCGFRGEELVAILVMLGSATTVVAFTMARGMGHQGALTSTAVMLTTLLSPITLAAWLFILKTFALI